MNWKNKKPKPTKECLLLTASYFAGNYEYHLFQILKTDYEDKWYWGIYTADGDEWGDYADLKADLYLTMPLLTKPK